MRAFLALLFLVSGFSVLTFSPAKAEIYFVEDQNNRFSVSFPDTWILANNQKADDKLTVAAPGPEAYAGCRVRLREDRRFVYYPQKFSDSVQKVAYSREFWEAYLGEYDNAGIDIFKDEAGLGRGDASFAEATYTTAQGAILKKRSLLFATLYHDKAYILDCAAEESFYDQFRPAFLGIAKSVDMKPVTHEFPTGDYRNFLGDKKLEVVGPREKDSRVY